MAKRYLNDTDNIEFGKSTAYADSAILTPTALSVDVNDYNPTGFQDGSGNIVVSVLRLQTDGSGVKDITGLLASTTLVGEVIMIMNIGTQNIRIMNNNALSSVENRFLLNANAVLGQNECASFIYDTISQRWRHLNDYK